MEGVRIYLGGLVHDVSEKDLASLLSAYNPKDIHVTDKGFGFATVPANKINSCK